MLLKKEKKLRSLVYKHVLYWIGNTNSYIRWAISPENTKKGY